MSAHTDTSVSSTSKASKDFPLVSIVISNYNGKNYIRECLSSLRRLKYPRFEVIVVDCGSTDGAPDMVEKEFPEINLIRTVKMGIGEALNLGISIANGGIIASELNSDHVVDELWLDELVETLMSSDQIGIVGGKRYFYGSDRKLQSLGGRIDMVTGTNYAIGYNQTDSERFDVLSEVDYVPVATMKREVLDRIGLYDPDYYLYSEDVDICWRAKKAGFRIVCNPSAMYWHHGSAIIGRSSYRQQYYLVRSRIRFVIKNFPVHFMLTSLFRYMIIEPFLSLLMSVIHPSHASRIKATLDGIFYNLKHLNKTIQARHRERASSNKVIPST